MKFSKHLIPVILLAGAAAVASITAVSMALTYSLVQDGHEGDFELVRKTFGEQLNAYGEEAQQNAEILSSIPGIRKAFLDRDRKALIEECGSVFSIQSEKYDFDHAQFHEPGAVSFLRLHNPGRFGDNQSDTRPMLVDAQREEAIRKGIEMTKGGPIIAGIVPIFDASKKFQGTFEMGLEPEAMFNELKGAFGIEGTFFMDENFVRTIGSDMSADTFAKHKLLGSYVSLHTTNEALMKDLVHSHEIDVSEEKHFERAAAGSIWGVQLIPLYNQAHKKIGVAALAVNFGDDRSAVLKAIVWEGLTAVFAIVVLAGVVITVIRGWLLAPIRTLSERLRQTAAGEDPGPDPVTGEYCEELSEMARSSELLRNRGSDV